MDVHATEKEQLEALGKWWKENGSSIVIGLLLGVSVLLGGKAWMGHRENQALIASNIYAQMLAANSQKKNDLVRENANQLISNYSGSSYASFAALMLAKLAVTDGQLDAAGTQLKWAMNNAKSPETENTARLRLIRVLVEQAQFDEARAQLAVADRSGAFNYLYLELEGDLAMAEGDNAKAADAYRRALDAMPEQSPSAALLTTKYESIAGAGETSQ